MALPTSFSHSVGEFSGRKSSPRVKTPDCGRLMLEQESPALQSTSLQHRLNACGFARENEKRLRLRGNHAGDHIGVARSCDVSRVHGVQPVEPRSAHPAELFSWPNAYFDQDRRCGLELGASGRP